jgi:hypothetical protein
MESDLEGIRGLLQSYIADQKLRERPWPVERHTSWDAVDDLRAKLYWIHQMLSHLVASGQISGVAGNESQHPCPGFLISFPDAWACGAAFAFSGDGGVLVSEAFLPECARTSASGETGLRVFYSNSGTGFGGWGLQWDGSPAGQVNAFQHDFLTFWVKGDVGGEIFQIGLKDTAGVETKRESPGYVAVTTDWQQVVIPLADFTGVNKGAIVNWNLGFNSSHGHGVICVDDARFTG